MIRVKGDPIFRGPVTKALRKAVTKSTKRARNSVTQRILPEKGGDRPNGQVKASVTPPAREQRGAGRPKVHATKAAKQAAYRARLKEAKA